jgi:hypothetical protein
MSNNKKSPYMQSAFLICASVLLLACVSKKVVLDYIFEFTKKTPIALEKSLDEIDREKLAPYKVVNVSEIGDKEVVEALGTEDYIQWILEDTEVSEKSPVRFCQLFITYYPMATRVPHVPDECYTGSGYEKRAGRYVSLDIDGQADPIKMRLLVFGGKKSEIWSSDPDFSRMYFLLVNNEYVCTRTGARQVFGKNLRGKHSFFSKVEWEFYGRSSGGRIRPSDEQNTTASEKLMAKLLPVLEKEHWPDLAELERIENTDNKENNEMKIIDDSKDGNE